MRGKLHSYLLAPDTELTQESGYEQKDELIKDLNLKVIFQAASRPVWKAGDSLKTVEKEDFYIYDTVKRLMLIPVLNPETLLYRQKIVETSLSHRELIKNLYEIGGKAGTARPQRGGKRGVVEHLRIALRFCRTVKRIKTSFGGGGGT